MEHILNKGIIGYIIIFHTTLFLTLLTTRIASEPLWIWTKGCRETNSGDFLNQTESTPYTCFRACGENTLNIALQGHRCSCNPQTRGIQPPSHCNPCDGNKMTACGNVAYGYWSLYERAKEQELAEHGINATGCVVYNSDESYSVENCSKEIRSLCLNEFSHKPYCSAISKKWSTDACSTGNGYDRLVDTFSAVERTHISQCVKVKYWIGLLSVDRASSHIVTSLSSESVISPTSVDFSFYNISQTTFSTSIILNLISPIYTSATSNSTDVSPTDVFSNLSPTYISSTNAPSYNISPSSTLTDVSSTDVSSDLPPTYISSFNTLSNHISPTSVLTEVFPTDISSELPPTFISSTDTPSTYISPTSTLNDVSHTDISSGLPLNYISSTNIPSNYISTTSISTDVSPGDVSSDSRPTYIFSTTAPSTYISPSSAFTNSSPTNISLTYVSSTYTSLTDIPNNISPFSISPTDISLTNIFPTNAFLNNTSPTKISSTIASANVPLTNSSLSEIPSVTVLNTKLTTSSKSPTIKVMPLLSSAILNPTGRVHVIHTSISHTPTVVRISPSVKTSLKSSQMSPTTILSNDFMTTRLRTSETFNRKTSVKPTSHKHFKTLKHKLFGASSSEDTGSTTPKELTPRSHTVIETALSSARTESKDKDTMVALIVVGLVSAIALVIVAALAVYVRRSMKVIQLQQRRMTTLSDGPTLGSEETIFTDGNGSERSNDFCHDIPNTFSTARRADLHVQGNWSLFSNRGRTVHENEYVLY